MVTRRAQQELERSASWPAVASGLRWLAVVWGAFTLLSVVLQLLALQLGTMARAGDPGALGSYALISFLSQGAYSLLAALLVVAAAKLTRAPPKAAAVMPAVVAGVGFLLAALVNAVLWVAERVAPEARTMDVGQIEQLWITLAAARAVALTALILALLRLARATAVRLHPIVAGSAFALAWIDTGYPLWRVLSGTRAAAQPASARGGLLLVQVLLAVLLVDLARRVRRGVRALPAAPPSPPPAKGSEREPRGARASSAPDEAPASLAPPSAAALWTMAVATGLAVALLPIWDAVLATSSLAAFKAEISGAPGTVFPSTALGFAAAGVVLGVMVGRVAPRAPFAARAVFLLAALLALGYAGVTGIDVALDRSRRIDEWPVCETNLDVRGDLLKPESVFRGRYSGPRLSSGEPCTAAAERRDLHQQQSPGGTVQDGLIQIATRFPDDRARVLYGSLAVLLALGVGGWLVFRAAEWRSARVEDKSVAEARDPGG
jgi:hypothetical protein